MCGISGFLDRRRGSPRDLQATARKMAEAISYRGPDALDVFADPESGVALGHNRLSIIDLTPSGAQPMSSRCGRFVIVYNGEVYNFQELRTELQARGREFHGTSDTEVILEAIAEWGLFAAVERFIGMFAFALWDRRERRLSLVRDRLGVKPLYWGKFDDLLIFGSELKALRAHPGWRAQLDIDALSLLFRYNNIPAPHSVYRGVFKLEPGHILSIDNSGRVSDDPYFSLFDMATAMLQRKYTDSQQEIDGLIERADGLLRQAVRRRMIADVPVGAFLSGGIDSSLVAALMQQQANMPIRTFSIGFNEPGYNEAHFARAIADYLGTQHTEFTVGPKEAFEVIPRLAQIYDEPFADPSQIPTYLVSRETRRHVKVALSGDGGDELFLGYSRYAIGARGDAIRNAIPRRLRHLMGRVIGRMPLAVLDPLGAMVLGRRLNWTRYRVEKLANILCPKTGADALYPMLVSLWPDPASLVNGAMEPDSPMWDKKIFVAFPDFMMRARYLDTTGYLPNDILVKVDRATMSVGLEGREPLLDQDLLEFAWSLPRNVLARRGSLKWILRQVLKRYVPEHLFERPKMGFGVPIGTWLRAPLREWAEDLLSEKSLSEDGLLDVRQIRQVWQNHKDETSEQQYLLWTVLIFQQWRREWRPDDLV
jgi:asparagine synthase (glutamine-hydrolysing)